MIAKNKAQFFSCRCLDSVSAFWFLTCRVFCDAISDCSSCSSISCLRLWAADKMRCKPHRLNGRHWHSNTCRTTYVNERMIHRYYVLQPVGLKVKNVHHSYIRCVKWYSKKDLAYRAVCIIDSYKNEHVANSVLYKDTFRWHQVHNTVAVKFWECTQSMV